MQEYQNLIIGGIVVVVLVIIALMFVLKNKKSDTTTTTSQPKQTPPTPKPQVKKEEPKQEAPKPQETQAAPSILKEDKPEPQAAPSILKEEAPKKEPKKTEVPTQARVLPTRTKREVPAHGKINKENFKEFAGLRVLVAEDNMINQKVIKGLLADSGIELVIANDGQEAIDILEKDSNFEFVLMDAHMPNIDGFEATRIIRANPAYDHILVVALSGDTAADDIRKMQDAGMEEQLEKPLKMDALYDVFYTYAKNIAAQQEEEEVVEETTQVDDDKELDYQKGLETCGSDEGFYAEILREFVDTYTDAADRLDDLIIDEDFNRVHELLHEILGVTANIGADKMHALTTELKASLKETDGESYADYAEKYREKLDKLIAEIKEHL